MNLLRNIQATVLDHELNITLHAQQQMISRRISIGEVRKALISSTTEVIEDYPGDPRGSSCLVYGKMIYKLESEYCDESMP